MGDRKIIWESQHMEIDTKHNTIKYAEEPSDILQEEQMENIGEFPPNIQDMIPSENMSITPFGMFRINDDMHPLKQFKLWMGHTSFNIDKKTANIINAVPGVEVFRVISRYRFIIGVGKTFDTITVKRKIEQSLSCNVELGTLLSDIKDDKIKKKATKIIDFLNKYNHWSLLIFPNGNMEFGVDTDAHYTSLFLLHKSVKELSNGILIQQ